LHQLALEELDSQGSRDDAYWNNRAALKAKLGLYKESLLCYDLALAVRIHPLYYANKARVYESLKLLPDCLALLKKATNLIKEEWFELNNFDPLEAKTIIYLIYQNKLGALYDHYRSLKNLKSTEENNNNTILEDMKTEILDCIDYLYAYTEGQNNLKEALDKIKEQIEINELNNDLLFKRERPPIECSECGKKDTYNYSQVPSFSSCANCRSSIYCSKECQKMHWSDHKEFCKRAEFIFSHQQEKKKIKKKENDSKNVTQKQNKNE